MIVTLTGPSCAGKSTLEAMLVERGFAKAISTTTRPIRDGEITGSSYYFVTHDEFAEMEAANELVESVRFGNNCYGLSAAEVKRLMEEEKPIVIVCEPHGQQQIAEYCRQRAWPSLAVYVDNPQEVIANRFLTRLNGEIAQAFLPTSRVIKLLETYSQRLTEMMTTEQRWREDAQLSNCYNLRFWTFDETNSNEVADIVSDVAFGKVEKAMP